MLGFLLQFITADNECKLSLDNAIFDKERGFVLNRDRKNEMVIK